MQCGQAIVMGVCVKTIPFRVPHILGQFKLYCGYPSMRDSISLIILLFIPLECIDTWLKLCSMRDKYSLRNRFVPSWAQIRIIIRAPKTPKLFRLFEFNSQWDFSIDISKYATSQTFYLHKSDSNATHACILGWPYSIKFESSGSSIFNNSLCGRLVIAPTLPESVWRHHYNPNYSMKPSMKRWNFSKFYISRCKG